MLIENDSNLFTILLANIASYSVLVSTAILLLLNPRSYVACPGFTVKTIFRGSNYVIHQNKNHLTLQTYYYTKISNQFFLSLVLNESDHETPARPYHIKLKM